MGTPEQDIKPLPEDEIPTFILICRGESRRLVAGTNAD